MHGTYACAMSSTQHAGEAIFDAVDPIYDCKVWAEPPVNPTTYSLGIDEKVLFYQLAQWPVGFAKDECEVVVTPKRVVLTHVERLRGFRGFMLKQRRTEVDVRSIQGYDSTLVIPGCCSLLTYILIFFIALFVVRADHVSLFRMAVKESPKIPEKSLGFLADTLWVFGGPCGHVADCAHRGRKRLQALRGGPPTSLAMFSSVPATLHDTSIDRPSVSEGGGFKSFLQLRRSVSERGGFKRREAAILEGSSINNTRRGMANSTVEVANALGSPHCADFPEWADEDSNTCSQYAVPGWALSCASTTASDAQTEIRNKRRDETALGLSPQDACCICGGGNGIARKLAIKKITDLLWPIINSVSGAGYALPVPPKATAAIAAFAYTYGEEAMSNSISLMSSQQLWSVGQQLAQLQAHLVGDIAGTSQIPPEVYKIITQLYYSFLKQKASSANGEWPASSQGSADSISMGLANVLGASFHIQMMLLCLVRLASILTMLWCLLRVYSWKVQRFDLARIYVVLRVQRDFFGEAPGDEACKPPEQLPHGMSKLVSFYLPAIGCTKEDPSRLREFAAATFHVPQK